MYFWKPNYYCYSKGILRYFAAVMYIVLTSFSDKLLCITLPKFGVDSLRYYNLIYEIIYDVGAAKSLGFVSLWNLYD